LIPTVDEFFAAMPQSQSGVVIEYARVVGFAANGEPLLSFDNEPASQKIYPRMRHVTGLRPGDRVRLVNGIIDGTWASVSATNFERG